MLDIGDVHDYFSIQSSSKIVTWATALQEVGEQTLHSYVGAPSPHLPVKVLHSDLHSVQSKVLLYLWAKWAICWQKNQIRA